MAESNLERLRRLLDEAAMRPWTVEVEAGDEWWFGGGGQAVLRDIDGDPVMVYAAEHEGRANAELIALAVNLLPDLLDLCENRPATASVPSTADWVADLLAIADRLGDTDPTTATDPDVQGALEVLDHAVHRLWAAGQVITTDEHQAVDQ